MIIYVRTCVCNCLTCLCANQRVLGNHHNDSGKGRHGKSRSWKGIQLPYLAHATVESLGPDVQRRTPVKSSMPWQRNTNARRWKFIYSCTFLNWVRWVRNALLAMAPGAQIETAQATTKQVVTAQIVKRISLFLFCCGLPRIADLQ